MLIISRLNPRAFPAELDFLTSPGQRCKGKSRGELGMPGAGPVKVITDNGVLENDPETGELVLTGLYPGVTEDEVKAGVGWPLRADRCHKPWGGTECGNRPRCLAESPATRSPSRATNF